MNLHADALRFLDQEAHALLSRLQLVMPFILNVPMVRAAMLPADAQLVIEQHMATKRLELHSQVHAFLRWLNRPADHQIDHVQAQRLFTLLRLRFNAVLDQLDIFADVVTQRSEHGVGVWLAGLDAAAADALILPGHDYHVPPVVCYLDRGHGAAIRRVRTRLPGGSPNPVAIIRVPRERMVGSGIASSLVHEVGHQGSVLLDLAKSLQPVLQQMQKQDSQARVAWQFYERWISEIIADFWSVAKVGVASTLGLIGVVSLPRWFVFRMHPDDPHPFPWIRVKLSCAIGHRLYPHPQWRRLDNLWESFYPRTGLDKERQRLLGLLDATFPCFIDTLVNHRTKMLRGKSLIEAMSVEERQPARLHDYYRLWRSSPAKLRKLPPTMAFAVIGQAKADGKMGPEEEAMIVSDLLRAWALGQALETIKICKPKTTVSADQRQRSNIIFKRQDAASTLTRATEKLIVN